MGFRCSLLLLGLALAVLVAAPAHSADTPFYINAPDVNLRDAPNGDILLVFSEGDKVYLIKQEGKWAHISAPAYGKKGWVYNEYLSKSRPAGMAAKDECVKPNATDDPGTRTASKAAAKPAQKPASAAPAAGMARSSAENVNVRSDNSLTSKIVGQVDKGDKLYIVKVEDPWYYVSIPGRGIKGWVFGEYVNQLPRVEIKGQDVRLREEPSLDGRIKSELNKGDVFFKFEQKSGWVRVASSASGLNGWVKAEWVRSTQKSASRPYKVMADDVNFRQNPNVDSDIITELPKATQVKVLGRTDKWSYVEYKGKKGYVYSTYLDPAFKNAPKQVYGKSIGDRLIKRAQAMKGTPYVWGGESDGGVDCSGLIYKLLVDEGANAGNLPRRASIQMQELGQEVDKEDLEPGDLVFFSTYKYAGHVGLYLGDGNFIHASSAQHCVTISNLSEGYYKQRFCGARRITEDELKRLKGG